MQMWFDVPSLVEEYRQYLKPGAPEQFPRVPLVGAVGTAHPAGMMHLELVRLPALHLVDPPKRTYPALHVGVHSSPCANVVVQLPIPPFFGLVRLQAGMHTAAVKLELAEHCVVPDTVNPLLHVG
jgi:hypothetical protein